MLFLDFFFYNIPTRDDFLPVTRFLKLFHILPTVVVAGAGNSSIVSDAADVAVFFLLLTETLADISDLLNDENMDRFAFGGACGASFVVVAAAVVRGDGGTLSLLEERPKANIRAESFFTSDLIVFGFCCGCGCCTGVGVFGSGFVAGDGAFFNNESTVLDSLGLEDLHKALLAN